MIRKSGYRFSEKIMLQQKDEIMIRFNPIMIQCSLDLSLMDSRLLVTWGEVSSAHPWRSIIVHQTEGPAGSARSGAQQQAKNPTRRGVTVWVETDGTVYWAVPENLVPTHGDGANRNDNKYIDNGPTFHQVVGNNSIGVEFAGNYPDVTRGATEAQIAAWRILVKVLRARYGIPLERVYAHNWIDYKDARYCEGCALATLARQWGE